MIANLLVKLTKKISPRDEPRMWEYYRVEKAFEYIVSGLFIGGLISFILWNLK